MEDLMIVVLAVGVLGLIINIVSGKKEEKVAFCKTHKWLFDDNTGKLFCTVCQYRP